MCTLTYQEGPRTIEVKGFVNVQSAVDFAQKLCIENYFLRVVKEQGVL